MTTFPGYDAWKLATPYDDDPVCKCGFEDGKKDECTCEQDARDAADEKADHDYERYREEMAERKFNDE